MVEVVSLADGAELWTETSGTGPPVVLVHGGPGLWDHLGPVADLLDGTVHRYDQRGCGRSTGEEFTLDRFLNDLDELREHFGYERWTVFGHSFGANLALRYAARYPERTAALVYCSGTGLDWAAHRAEYRRRVAARLTPVQTRELAELDRRDRSWTEEVRWRTLNWLPDFVDPVRAESAAATELPINLRCNAMLNAEDEVAPDVSSVRCDVLVLHGSEDPRPVEAARDVPSTEFRILAGAGHHPWVERPEEFRDVVQRFLDR